MGVGTLPGFAIGRRDMLLRTPNGNIFWDCISFLDDATIAIIGAGHFCDRGVAPAFLCLDDRMESCLHATPVYVHAMDRKFATRLNSVITFWEDDELELLAGINLIRCGGHFTGSAVLHWAQGAGGRGALLTGDTITATPDRNVSFMRSSPNLIPLDASSVYHIADALQTWQFDMIYGSACDRVIQTDAQTVLSRSVTRYVEALTSPPQG
jgi:hypothetical protein